MEESLFWVSKRGVAERNDHSKKVCVAVDIRLSLE